MIYNIFIINRAGSLIYDWDSRSASSITNNEVQLSFIDRQMDFKLDLIDNRLVVVFGERDNVRCGHILTSINDEPVAAGGRLEKSNEDAMTVLGAPDRYPMTLKFAKPTLNTNEKIILSSMFHSMHAIAAQLSPVTRSSGIVSMDTDSYRLHCYQSMTGVKFVVVSGHDNGLLEPLLQKLYELYADFACKNPFYSLDMPVRCELFDQSLKALLEKLEKTNVINV